MLFSSPANILVIVVLNSGSGILLIAVLISSLTVTSSGSFFWGVFLHLVILSRSLLLCVCVCVKETCFISCHFKKRTCTVQGLALQEVFQRVYSAVMFWLLFPSGQSSAEFLLVCTEECLDLVQYVVF